jgi:hypothetical protein
MSISRQIARGGLIAAVLAGCGPHPDAPPEGNDGNESAGSAQSAAGANGFTGTGGYASSPGFAGAACAGCPTGFPQSAGGAASTGGSPQYAGGSGGSVYNGSGGFLASGGAAGASPAAGGMATGTGGFAGSGGTSSVSDGAPCIGAPSEVVILGDSYVTGAASPALAPALGALNPAALQFRNYAVPGTSLATGGLAGVIPPQLDLAIAMGTNIPLIIMDGGGNDILLCDSIRFPGCNTLCNRSGSSAQKVCTDIVGLALDTLTDLLHKAASAGVADIVYFFYPHVPANFGGYVEMIDYAEPLFRATCDGAVTETAGQLTCHFVSLIEPFIAAGGDMSPLNFALDGIHPSQAGQDIIAREINNVMQSECLGQNATSGCCVP